MSVIHHPNVITDGLVAIWDAANRKSYPTTGTVWTDLVGGNDGTLDNGPTFDSANGGSIVFDGSDDNVDCGNQEQIQMTSAITATLWLKANTVSSYTTAMAKSDGSTNGWTVQLRGADDEWRFWINFGSNTLGDGSNNGWYYAKYPKSWQDNDWHHLTGIWDGANKVVKIYIDSKAGSFNSGASPSSESSNFSDYDGSLKLGGQSNDANLFSGNISDVSIYNRALTGAEVLQNYNATKGRFGH